MKIILLLSFVLLLFAAILKFGATSSGWTELSKTYRSFADSPQLRWTFLSAWMGSKGKLFRFRNCLNAGADQHGLYLSMFPPFSLAVRPLFIPWGHITLGRYEGFVTDYLDLHFRDVPWVTLRLSSAKAKEILTSAPRNLPNLEINF